MPSKPPSAFAGLLLLLGVIGLWHALQRQHPVADPTPVTPSKSPTALTEDAPIIDETAVGLEIMQGYASRSSDIRKDLQQLSDLLQCYQTLVKVEDALPFASNLDMAAALRGNNAVRTAFLPAQHPAFDDTGHLVDRWGHPLFFHVLSATQIEIRSAGPDRELWTADDVQRSPKGDYLTGIASSSPSP